MSVSNFDTLPLEETLEDLSARFIVNLPAEELESLDRVCFQIEQAHWYYEDFVRPQASNPSLLPSFSLKQFSLLIFKTCPLLQHLVPQHAAIWTSFMAYKERVPVCGAILISKEWDKVLLVKGWNKGASWSFPRGKINKDESEAACAVREVLEETGFDMSNYFSDEQLRPGYEPDDESAREPYYVEVVIKEQKIRLFFIPGVSEQTVFETKTRKEISRIEWFKLGDLPTWAKDRKKKAGTPVHQVKQAKFYMVTPFISHLKLWIEKNRPKKKGKQRDSRVDADEEISAVQPATMTNEESTEALKAFFFGSVGAAAASERENVEVVQPRPKASPQQTSSLLALLQSPPTKDPDPLPALPEHPDSEQEAKRRQLLNMLFTATSKTPPPTGSPAPAPRTPPTAANGASANGAAPNQRLLSLLQSPSVPSSTLPSANAPNSRSPLPPIPHASSSAPPPLGPHLPMSMPGPGAPYAFQFASPPPPPQGYPPFPFMPSPHYHPSSHGPLPYPPAFIHPHHPLPPPAHQAYPPFAPAAASVPPMQYPIHATSMQTPTTLPPSVNQKALDQRNQLLGMLRGNG